MLASCRHSLSYRGSLSWIYVIFKTRIRVCHHCLLTLYFLLSEVQLLASPIVYLLNGFFRCLLILFSCHLSIQPFCYIISIVNPVVFYLSILQRLAGTIVEDPLVLYNLTLSFYLLNLSSFADLF